MKLLLTILIAAAACHMSMSQVCSPITESDRILSTQNGQIRGMCVKTPVYYSSTNRSTSADIMIWRSVPYAQPPVGNLRFRAPVPLSGQWSGIRDGRTAPKACLQQLGTVLSASNSQMSEDCLYLNIYVQKNSYLNRSRSLKPVLVYIHGGGFLGGSSYDVDGSTVAAMADVVVVTVQYRLNALGFLHAAGTHATGNQGLLDNQMALRWVAENARSFGGDSAKVTVSGESAGAWTVGFLLFMPASWPYFRNAILQSGGVTGINNLYRLRTSQDATKTAQEFFSVLGCSRATNALSLSCAAGKTEAEIIKAYDNILGIDTQVIDNIVFSRSIPELTAANAFKKCNIMTGIDSDEYALFMWDNLVGFGILNIPDTSNTNSLLRIAQNFNMNQLRTSLTKIYQGYPFNSPLPPNPALANAIINEYFTPQELANTATIKLISRLSKIMSDHWFNCQAFQLSSIYSRAGNNAFLYNFNYRLPTSSIPRLLSGYFGPATHADELWVTFANPVSSDGFSDFTQADRDLTVRIVSYWTNFVKFDNPSAVSSSGMTNWLPYSSTSYETGRYLLMSKEGMTMQAGIRHCQFWDRQWFN